MADFDGDNFTNLAVGAPDEDVGAIAAAGVVNVLYGPANGLVGSTQQFYQGNLGVAGTAEAGDRFGDAVTKGDFNSDGHLDLAVGAPGEDVGGIADAGRSTSCMAGRAGWAVARSSSRAIPSRATGRARRSPPPARPSTAAPAPAR